MPCLEQSIVAIRAWLRGVSGVTLAIGARPVAGSRGLGREATNGVTDLGVQERTGVK